MHWTTAASYWVARRNNKRLFFPSYNTVSNILTTGFFFFFFFRIALWARGRSVRQGFMKKAGNEQAFHWWLWFRPAEGRSQGTLDWEKANNEQGYRCRIDMVLRDREKDGMFQARVETVNVNEDRWRTCSYTVESFEGQREAYTAGTFLGQLKEECLWVLRRVMASRKSCKDTQKDQ